MPNSRPNSRPGQPPVHPSSKPPPPPPSHDPQAKRHPPSRSSKSFSQGRPPATIGPGPQSRTPLPIQRVSQVSSDRETERERGRVKTLTKLCLQDDTSIQNGKLSKPPPPPVRTVSRQPPPPPGGSRRPSQPPPPPPDRRDLPPPPPPSHQGSGPPRAPQRKESLRPVGQQSAGDTFEAKFAGKFRSLQYLPPPELFSRCQKTYPSKNQGEIPV